ncbi:MAG: hypothetical protein A2516_03930 [Alphaproteobacteria bacterium RIFOXYD12_FULL_60_8]|nr:MAG: hypothetical protein A2516_03930 [Alphaproteobacteria bacterium RIFOXYD12_FULL_60_8]
MTLTRSLAALALLALIASCGGGPQPPRDQFYRLDIAPPSVVLDKPVLNGGVEIDRFQADGVTIERAIAYSEDKSQLTQYAYHYWVDTPVLMLRDILVEQMRAAHVAPLVTTPENRAASDFSVLGKVKRFEHRRDNGASAALLEIELTVLDARNGTVLLLKDYAVEEAAADASVPAAVDAMNRAVFSLSAKFLTDLSHLTP